MKKLILLALLTGFVPAVSAQSGGGVEFSKDAQAADFTHDITVGEYERFSIQVDYEDNTPSAATVSDGDFDDIAVTVTDYTGLVGTAASATITLQDGSNTSAIDGAIITINGHPFTEGVDWDRLAISTMTMNSLKTVIDGWNSEYTATVSSNVVTVTADNIGTAANSWTITTSTGVLAVSGANFASGQEPGYIFINGTTLTEGTDFTAETSSATTAGNLAAAINADSTLSTIVSASTTSLGVVTITNILSGVYYYPVSVSNIAHLTPDSVYMNGGASTEVSVSGDSFTEASHGFGEGLAVLFSTVTNSTAPTGLTNQTTYYVIPLTANTFQLSTTSTGAVAGAEIDVTAVTGGGSFTFTPITFAAGSAGFDFRGSNDGSTFYDLTGDVIGGVTVSSVTYSADGGDLWNFDSYPYKYLRFNFVGPDTGGMNIDATIHWRRD